MANAASTNAVSASQATTATTTLGLGTAFKGLGIKIKQATASMKTFLLTTPAEWATLAISAIVSVVAAYNKYLQSIEDCKKRVNELISSYKSALNEANANADTVKKLASRYKELSGAVNNLGRNVSLTTEEYDEYNNIVNQIADMFPELVQGYINEGNAILSLKGNVDQLTTAYQDAQQAAYSLLTDSESSNDILKNWENLHNSSVIGSAFINGFTQSGSVENGAYSLQEALSLLKEFNQLSYKDFITNEFILDGYLHNALSIDTYDYANISEAEFQALKSRAKALTQTYQAEMVSALSSVRMLANAYLMTQV